jgi:radical SAM protein with 4Fe4S-binding SPASM domain
MKSTLNSNSTINPIAQLHEEPTMEKYKRPFPRVIRIEPAGVCNLRCVHCSTLEAIGKGGLLSQETYQIVLDTIKRNIKKIDVVVLYHGGEPLLHRDFSRIVKEIKGLGVRFVKTISNGMLLTEANMQELIESGLDSIEFSLDGESSQENDFIRVRGPYEKIVKNVKRLIDLKMQMNSATPEVLISNVQFLKKENLEAIKNDPAPPQYLIDEFSGSYKGQIGRIKSNWARPWLDMGIDSDLFDIHEVPEMNVSEPTCDHVENIVTIRWNGDIVPCCFDLTGKQILGNIHQNTLEKLWNDSPYLDLRKSIKTGCFNSICKKCYIVGEQRYFMLKDSIRNKFITSPLAEHLPSNQ